MVRTLANRLFNNWKFGLVALLLALAVFTGLVSPLESRTASAHVLMPAGICHMRMTPIDKAPGDWWDEHNKSVIVPHTGPDHTGEYRNGTAYITYNGGNAYPTGYFDRNSFWVQPQTAYEWGIRTRWTWFNPNFVQGDWELWYPC